MLLPVIDPASKQINLVAFIGNNPGIKKIVSILNHLFVIHRDILCLRFRKQSNFLTSREHNIYLQRTFGVTIIDIFYLFVLLTLITNASFSFLFPGL